MEGAWQPSICSLVIYSQGFWLRAKGCERECPGRVRRWVGDSGDSLANSLAGWQGLQLLAIKRKLSFPFDFYKLAQYKFYLFRCFYTNFPKISSLTFVYVISPPISENHLEMSRMGLEGTSQVLCATGSVNEIAHDLFQLCQIPKITCHSNSSVCCTAVPEPCPCCLETLFQYTSFFSQSIHINLFLCQYCPPSWVALLSV